MKRIACIAIVVSMLVGCTQRNAKGECVGLAEDKQSGVEYDISYLNVFLAFLLSETMVVPIVVGGWMLECPVE